MNKRNTWIFESFKVTRSSFIITQYNAENPNKTRDYVTHLKELSEERFNKRLTDITNMIKAFRDKEIELMKETPL